MYGTFGYQDGQKVFYVSLARKIVDETIGRKIFQSKHKQDAITAEKSSKRVSNVSKGGKGSETENLFEH